MMDILVRVEKLENTIKDYGRGYKRKFEYFRKIFK